MQAPLTHEVTGSGEPLLLLNGGLMTIAAWTEVVTPLQDHFQVIRFDFRGQLLSPGEPPHDLAGHAADVLELLDSLSLDAVHLVGTSFGGFVAATVATMHPERVRSLTLVAITDFMTEEMKEGSRLLRDAALAAAEGGDRNRLGELIIPTTFTPEYIASHADRFQMQRAMAPLLPVSYYRGVAAMAELLDGVDLRPVLPRIRCRSLVIAGSEDALFPLPHSQAVAAAIPGAILKVIEGGPHGLVVERAEDVVQAIREFLVPKRAVDSGMART